MCSSAHKRKDRSIALQPTAPNPKRGDRGVAWEPRAASIWRLPEMRALFAAGARRLYIEQCAFGGRFYKPTGLLDANLGLDTRGCR